MCFGKCSNIHINAGHKSVLIFNPKGKQMKKLVFLAGAVAAIATTIASAALIISSDKQTQFERAARLQNLSTVAVKNGDYALACKAEREVADALSKAGTKGKDIVGSVAASKDALCQKASKVAQK